ncbi:hypothetical protein, partial [Leptospira sp. Pond_2020]|uniref:hypothetical protein n=1 Tax=Leptospira sp. Pond_2020 TaxID=2846916 RepID=UPI001E42FE82
IVKMNSDLVKRLDVCEEMLENGIVPAWIFVDTLKDEKRKQSKLESFGGTRVFCSGPQDMVVLYRQYTQHFVTAFMHNRHQLMHAVGCNPLSEEWTRIAEHLFSNGEDWSTIDYSNFGPGFNVLVCERAHALVASWLQKYCGFPFDKMMTLFYPCIQSVHIVHNLVYTQLAGSPSGAPLTTVINT